MIFCGALLATLKSETAAAIITTSVDSKKELTASCIDSAESTDTYSTPLGISRDVGVLTRITRAFSLTAAAAIAYPIFPLDRLPIYLTGSIFSCVPPAVTRTVLPTNLPVPSRECNSSVNQLTMSSGDGSLPTPVTPQASQPASGCII